MLVAPGSNGTANLRALSDGAGGYYAFWRDKRTDGTNYDVYGQRFDPGGNALWAESGALIFHEDSATTDAFTVMRTDGGDLYLATIAGPSTFIEDLKVTLLDEDGTPLWDSAVTVTSSGSPVLYLDQVDMIPTSDGAIIGWYDVYFGGSSGVNVARIKNNGDLTWTEDGYAIPYATYGPFNLLPDGADGVMVNWRDGNGLGAGYHCMRVDSSGANAWAANVATNQGGAGFGGDHVIISGEEASLILAYSDYPAGHLTMARVDTAGNQVFAPSPVPVCSFPSAQGSARMVRQGEDIMVVWTDNRPPASNQDLYMQRMSMDGVQLLDTNGVLVMHTNTYIPTAGVVPSLNGGVIGTMDGTLDGYSAMRMNADGTPAWATPAAFCTPANNPFYAEQVQLSDGEGGVVSFWRTSTGNIHGARIYANGELGDHTGIVSLATGQETLQLAPVPAVNTLTAWLPRVATVRSVQVVDATGRAADVSVVQSGDRLDVDVATMANGPYFLRVITDGTIWTGRFLVAR